jgi:hypothetical protein
MVDAVRRNSLKYRCRVNYSRAAPVWCGKAVRRQCCPVPRRSVVCHSYRVRGASRPQQWMAFYGGFSLKILRSWMMRIVGSDCLHSMSWHSKMLRNTLGYHSHSRAFAQGQFAWQTTLRRGRPHVVLGTEYLSFVVATVLCQCSQLRRRFKEKQRRPG